MVYIPEWLLQKMHQHVNEDAPNEASGVVLRRKEGEGGVVYYHQRMENVSPRPRTEFSWDTAEHRALYDHMDEHDMEMWIIYHSHPETMPEPSSTDEHAAWYVGVHHLIFSVAGGPQDRWVNSYMCVEPGKLVIEEVTAE